MKETSIDLITQGKPESNPDTMVTQQETLSQVDIRTIAQGLAEEIKARLTLNATLTPQNKACIVVDILNPEQLLNNKALLNQAGLVVHEAILTPQELEPFMARIRNAVLEELHQLIDPVTMHFVVKQISRNNRVWRTHDNNILKRPSPSEDEQYRIDRFEAMKTLYALPKRSPYILYPTKEIDPSLHLLEMQQNLSFTTLDTILVQEPKEKFKTVLRYVQDALKGAQFLIRHTLALMDLAPANIAVHEETHRGMLFDFDGLRKQDEITEGYICHSVTYLPPERNPDKGGLEYEAPLKEPQMVYEFGATLSEVLTAYAAELPPDALMKIMQRMLSNNKKQRPTLQEVITVIQDILAPSKQLQKAAA